MTSSWMTSGLRQRWSRSCSQEWRPPTATVLAPQALSWRAADSEECPLAHESKRWKISASGAVNWVESNGT